eukprot:403338494
MFNTTAQCLTLSKFSTSSCQYVQFFSPYNQRETQKEYQFEIELPPQTGCQFMFNGTRSYTNVRYDSQVQAYYTKSGLNSFVNTTQFKSGSTIYVQDNGSILAQKTNFFWMGLVNFDKFTTQIVKVTIYQGAVQINTYGVQVLLIALSALYIGF